MPVSGNKGNFDEVLASLIQAHTGALQPLIYGKDIRPWSLHFSICKSLGCKLYLFWPYSLLEVVSFFKKASPMLLVSR